jgi:hypothetical protein
MLPDGRVSKIEQRPCIQRPKGLVSSLQPDRADCQLQIVCRRVSTLRLFDHNRETGIGSLPQSGMILPGFAETHGFAERVKKNRFPLPQKTHYGAARLGFPKSKIS